MISILCSPKPFVGQTASNQLNALRSWRAIHPEIEIFLFGAVQGAADAALEVGATHMAEIACSESGAPSFNAMASHASRCGRYDLQAYVNCDIILDATFAKAMRAASNRFRRFLLVGERLDLAPRAEVDVRQDGWCSKLVDLARMGQLTGHGPTGADYFAFMRGLWDSLPPVFMGRALCDQALLNHCFVNRIPIIDATRAILAIHHAHTYEHVRGGREEVFRGRDTALMARVHRLGHGLPTLADANWRLASSGAIEQDRSSSRLRRLELHLRYAFRAEWAALLVRALERAGAGGRAPHESPRGHDLIAILRNLTADSTTSLDRTGGGSIA